MLEENIFQNLQKEIYIDAILIGDYPENLILMKTLWCVEIYGNLTLSNY